VNIKSYANPFKPVKLIHSDNLSGPGMADQVIMGDQLEGCMHITDCLTYLLHGGVIFKGSPPTIYSSHTPVALSGGTKPMAVMLDGIIMDQGTAFNMISPLDIYSIEMLESPSYFAIYGSAATGGLMVVTTRRGDERNPINIQAGLTTYTFKGFNVAREFYSPKYDATKSVSLADNRKTIYWNPNIISDTTGKASVEYFSVGGKGNYYVVVEGIDGNGKLARRILRYRVDEME
jgi:hypothetical protein